MQQEKLLEILKADLNSIPTKDISIEDCNKIALNLWNLSNKNYEQCLIILNLLKSNTNKVKTFKNNAEYFVKKLSTNNNDGPWGQTNINKSNYNYSYQKQANTYKKEPSFNLNKISIKVIFWTLLRLLFSLIFFAATIKTNYDKPDEIAYAFSNINLKYSIHVIFKLFLEICVVLIYLLAITQKSSFCTRERVNNLKYSIIVFSPITFGFFVSYVCLRAAFENSNIWSKKPVNNFRKWDFSYWKKSSGNGKSVNNI